LTKSIHTGRYKRLRELLCFYRERSGLTQSQLAQAIDRPQSFVSKVESGERRVDVVELIELLTAMKADPIDFLAALMRRKG
jgi:transcriptional regulator with XRE-family HTH domain